MDTDRNLLFGVIALQADLLDTTQFAEGCAAWAARKNVALAELLVERGWLTSEDRDRVEWLLERKLKKYGGNASASLAAAITPEAQRVLALWDDPAIQSSLAKLSQEPNSALLSAGTATPITRDRYTLTALHAKGGIGQVWRAHDAQLGRDIALKELRPERARDGRLRHYFVTEAQVTGQLEHPGIVPIYELTQSAGDGLPFYTMRFVQGRTLTAAIQAYHAKRQAGTAGPLDLRELLDAFVKVCQTVAYAHARGVIHRDLKGQNIVLGDFGAVIVLDWGFAKVLGQPEPDHDSPPVVVPSTEGVHGTLPGEVIGTPAYMAPEQAEGRLDRIDRRTDVYGLGAILYEILTAQPPFSGVDPQDVLRRVREDQPAKPRALRAEVPPALEAVCLKALAKTPGERYASAGELARDVQQWLADEPVAVYREPLIARLGRWAKRHRSLVTGAAVLLLTGLAALSVSTVLITREKARTQAMRSLWEVNFQRARHVVEKLGAVAEEDLANVPGMEPVQKTLLENVLAFEQDFVREQSTDFMVRQEMARAVARVGKIRDTLGQKPEAEQAYRQALVLLQELAQQFPDPPKAWDIRGRVANRLGMVLRDQGKYAEAKDQCEQGLEMQQRLATAFPEEPSYQSDLADCHNNLANILRDLGSPREAERHLRQCSAIQERLVAKFPNEPAYARDWARTLGNLGGLLVGTGSIREAEEILQKSVAQYEILSKAKPFHAGLKTELAGSLGNLAACFQKSGQVGKAKKLDDRIGDLSERLVADYPATPRFKDQLARYYFNRGNPLMNLAEKESWWRKAVAVQDELVRAFPAVPDYQAAQANYYFALGTVTATHGLDDAAEPWLQAQKTWEKLTAEHPANPDFPHGLAITWLSRSLLFKLTNRSVEAEKAYCQCRDTAKKLAVQFPTPPNFTQTLGNSIRQLGENLWIARQIPQAEKAYRETIKLLERLVTEVPSAEHQADLGVVNFYFANFLLGQKNPAEALYALRQGVAHQKIALQLSPQSRSYRQTLRNQFEFLVFLYRKAGSHAEAAEVAEQLILLGLDPAEDAYNAACVLSLCIPMAQKDATLPAVKRQELIQSFADRAMVMLRQAVAKGFTDADHVKKEPDLAPLRKRDDFQQLLAELEAKKLGKHPEAPAPPARVPGS